MNANEEILAGYADTDADLYINIMSLCFSNNNYDKKTKKI